MTARADSATQSPSNPLTGRDADELRALADRAAKELEGADALTLLQWTLDTFGEDFIVASNMQDGVLVHLAKQVQDRPKVLFLDTGYHFPETIGMRDAVELIYEVELLNVTPAQSVGEQDATVGKDLFASDPAQCCNLRKVVPLRETLKGYRAWVTGIRRVESPTRANAPFISFDEGFGLLKVNPIVDWSDEQMQQFIEENGILVNPLVDEGYPSIGCQPCTNKPAPGSDPRSGRWAGSTKTECGLHAS